MLKEASLAHVISLSVAKKQSWLFPLSVATHEDCAPTHPPIAAIYMATTNDTTSDRSERLVRLDRHCMIVIRMLVLTASFESLPL